MKAPREPAKNNAKASLAYGSAMEGTTGTLCTPALSFDPAAYREFLADSDLSESQRQELLRALWEVIIGFVDLGFGLHPFNHVSQNAKIVEADSRDVLFLKDISESKQETWAARFTRAPKEIDS